MKIEELYKILLSDKPKEEIIKKEDEIFKLIPELKICKGFDQHNEWHIYDVYDHILNVIDNVRPNIVLRLSALFHDIGKPDKFILDENGIGHFYGHWDKSKEIFEKFSLKYNINKDISNKVSNLIYFHDKNMSKLKKEEIEEILKVFDLEGIEMLFELKKADLLSQNSKYHYLLEDYKDQKKKLIKEYK